VKRKDIQTYLKMKIAEMGQRDLIVFLYESAIHLIEESKETITRGDLPGTHERLNRARNIFLHLLGTLNLDGGGDFARKLSSLYAYFVEKITMANTTKNVQELDDILPIIGDIKDAWIRMEDNTAVAAEKKNLDVDRKLVSLEV